MSDTSTLHWPPERYAQRVALVPLSERALCDILRDGLRAPLRIAGLPEDATLLGVHHDWNMQCFMLRFRSAAFDPVPEAMLPPSLALTVTLPRDEDEPGDEPAPERWQTVEAGGFRVA